MTVLQTAARAAISVDKPEESRAFAKKLEDGERPLGFPLLCDPSRAAVKAFGVYDSEHDIALPAVLILNRDGKIVWKYVGDNMTDRPAEDAIVAELRRLGQTPR